MAAAVTSAWSKKPGAWALDSEEHEAELKSEIKSQTLASNGGGGDAADFPSLTAAVTTKTKKKKPQAMSLAEFASPKTLTLTRDEAVSLPTGPRQRTAEELAEGSRLGGGFRSYGSNRASSDEPRKREIREPLGPSRADEADDWGSMKRPVEKRERGFFGGSDSKADESDNWGSNKSFVPSSEGRRFDNGRERRSVGFASSGAADTENWLKKKEEEGGRRFGGGAFDSLRERRGGFDSGDSDNWGKKREEVNNIGSDRPRLKLQPRTIPIPVVEQIIPVVVPPVAVAAALPKPRGMNPFGEARPREEVLKEKGKDWKEIDEKLENMKVKEIEVKKGFGGSNGREIEAERSWRKPDLVDVRPQSADKVENGADKVENGVGEEAQDLQE